MPDKYIYDPWNAPIEVQRAAKCVVGVDYPKPMVNHAEASRLNIERMRQMYQQLSKYRGLSKYFSPSLSLYCSLSISLSLSMSCFLSVSSLCCYLSFSHLLIITCLSSDRLTSCCAKQSY